MTAISLVRIYVLCLIVIVIGSPFLKCKENRRENVRINACFILILFSSVCFSTGCASQECLSPSPQEAYRLTYGGEVFAVVEGNEIACVYGSNGEAIIEKKQNGWKTSFYNQGTLKWIKKEGSIMISIYQHNDSEEYYVMVVDMEQMEHVVTDNEETVFSLVDYRGTKGYYAYVKQIDKPYIIVVDKKEIIVLE